MTEEQKATRRRNMWVSIAAIAAITVLEVVAMLTGRDGTTFSLAIGGIMAAGGFTLRSFIFPK